MFIAVRAARGVIGILLVLTLAGFSFGNSEADQRKAFIAFLQDINNRPGGHVLVPNANYEKAFGSYLQHYAIILDFNKDLTVSMQDFMAQMIKFGLDRIPARARSNRWRRRRRTSQPSKTSSTRWSRASKRGWRR